MSQLRTSVSALVVAILVGVAMLGSPPSSSAAPTTLLTDPGCETAAPDLQGIQATVARSTTFKHAGTASCKVTSTGAAAFGAGRSSANPAVGQAFTGAAWVRAGTSNGRDVLVTLRESGGSAAARAVTGTAVALTTSWQLVTATITVASPGRTSLDFSVTQTPGGQGQVFYADDLTFQVSTATTTSPSGQALPVGDLPGWHQVFAEDFTVDAPTGSWGASCATDPNAAQKVVYTGAGGTRWWTYPDCYKDTYNKRPYRSDQVLSVHDGVLDFHLRNVGGKPAGANPSPVINASADPQYQTYGRYTARFRTDVATLSEYHVAWLLYPHDDVVDYRCAESDFPEANLNATTVDAFAHYGCNGAQDHYGRTIDFTQWHTYTQEWAPGVRRYYLDDVLIGTSTHAVYAGPERWQLQTETKGNGTHDGHLTMDWVAVYSYQP